MNRFNRLSQYLLPIIVGFVLLLTGCQEETQTYTIGVINLAPQLEPVLDGFKEGMTELGYAPAQLTYIYAGPAPNIEALDDQIQALLAADVNLILAISTPATQAAYRATLDTDIPVVFGPVTDPIDAGVVTELSQPGGNVTGVALGTLSEGQRLQWLLRLVPDAERIYVPYNADDASANASVTAALAAATNAGVELVLHEVGTADEITVAINEIPDDVQAIFLAQDSLVAARIDDFAAAAIAHQLPLCTPTDGQVERGALVSYSFRLEALGKQMARLGDQILSGTVPADLPVETAEFFLTINMQTAVAIHLDISKEVLRAADKLIR
jgi:putative ABC transport system substrate-binding protein